MAVNKKLISLTVASIVSVSLSLASGAALAKNGKMEKCYGITKAGKNDCGTATHSCAGQAKVNNDPNEWELVDMGTCKKLGGGLTASAAGKKEEKKH